MTPPSKPHEPDQHPTTDVTRIEGKDIEEVEQDANIERGERLDSGKTIARGGKETGHVPGASESTPDK
jgi:hypothetical protein